VKLKEQGHFRHYSFVLDSKAIGFRFQKGKSFFSSQLLNPATLPSVLFTRHREFHPCRKIVMDWKRKLKPTYI
jgi:hypothetical protein